jgi:hypothetical protein
LWSGFALWITQASHRYGYLFGHHLYDRRNNMLRRVPFIVALAGVLATAHPVLADLLDSAPAEHAEAAAPVSAQTGLSAHAVSSPPIVTAPAEFRSQENAPAGFGWG